MSAQVSQQLSLEEQLKQLEEQLRDGKASAEGFRAALKRLDEASRNLQRLLEWATDQKKDDKELKRLYSQLAGENASSLIDRLRGLGYVLVHPSEKDKGEEKNQKKRLKEAFDNVGYRLMEQTRFGKRESVYHGLLRIFVSHKQEFPKDLIEPFKPVYSDEMFKIFVLSFLSGVLGKEEE